MSRGAIGRGWKALLCGAWMAAILLTACRKSEKAASQAAKSVLHPPFGYIDAPKENEAVTSGSRGYGWALDDSGVKRVAVSLDGGPTAAAELNKSSPAVREAYPTFSNSGNAGFIFDMPSGASGPHVLVVTIEGKDGGKTDLKRHVQIQ